MSPDAPFIQKMPKLELHVHLEGSIKPETVLALAKRNGVPLPATDVEGLKRWYEFRDFPHFVEVYVAVSKCIKSPEDLEFLTREFLQGQANQNILYTEATYTACTIERFCGIPVDEQIDAINRAILWGAKTLDTRMQLILDIVRGDSPERAMEVASWVKKWLGNGVCGLGLAGFENRGTKVYAEVFDTARSWGLPVAAHAGETEGAWSIDETLDVTGAKRIGHGVRALESPQTISRLRDEGVTLEVCPTSNLCLGVFTLLRDHPIQRLIDSGLKVTINSDDPPMFGTSLTEEFLRCAELFDWDHDALGDLYRHAVEAAFLDQGSKDQLLAAWQSSVPAG